MSNVRSQFGLTQESTWGTAVTVAKFYEFESESLTLDQTYSDSQGLRADATAMPSSRMRKTTRGAGGNVVLDVPTKLAGNIFNLMHSATVTPTQQGGTPAYLQTHPTGTTVPNRSATIQVNKRTREGTATAFTYPGAVLTGASFSSETSGTFRMTTTWDAKDETTPTTTPAGAALATASYASGSKNWVGTDTNTLTVNGTGVAIAQSISLNWAQPYDTGTYPLSTTATKTRPVANGLTAVTGEIVVQWNDTDDALYDLFRAGTIVGLVFTLRGDLISGSYYNDITFTVPAIQLRGHPLSVGGPDVAAVTIPFTAGYDGTNPLMSIAYTSTDTTL